VSHENRRRNPELHLSFSDRRRHISLTVQAIPEKWNNRNALRLTNGAVEVLLLAGGGHFAELRLSNPHGPTMNCLWTAPWPTADPDDADFGNLAETYGAAPAGPFLAGYTGHALCLDNFGPPSASDAAQGIPLHGEAAAQKWEFELMAEGCVGRVELPAAKLQFQRTVSLLKDSSVIFVEETVTNHGAAAREIHWVQHLSLGPPFLSPGQSSIHASLDHSMTWPLGYEGREMLRDGAAFEWPHAPSVQDGTLDLRIPFQRRGAGFLAAARVDITREIGYISVLNWDVGLALIYCFRREDFPWVAVWEENCARLAAPWNGVAQVRGMEFGTTPMPLGREAIQTMGSLFATPGSRIVPSGGTLHARYIACVAAIPQDWREISNVIPGQNVLTLVGPRSADRLQLPAEGLHELFLKGRKA
jgi:hypothetical protein